MSAQKVTHELFKMTDRIENILITEELNRSLENYLQIVDRTEDLKALLLWRRANKTSDLTDSMLDIYEHLNGPTSDSADVTIQHIKDWCCCILENVRQNFREYLMDA